MLGRIVQSVWQTLAATRPAAGTTVTGSGFPSALPAANRISASEVIDDEKLLQLAEEPERPLFAWLREDTPLAPLVLLLAALAPAFVVQSHSFNINDALWGEKALACIAAQNAGEFVDPASRDPDLPFRWQPPLITWLTAGLQSIFGAQRMGSLFLIPVLSAAGLIVSSVLFARAWGGSRAGLAAGILVASHPQLIQIAPRSAPWVAGLGLGMLALWAFLRHWNNSPRWFSGWLIVSGIVGGLSLLAGGPVALGFLAIGGLYVAWWGLGRKFATSSWTVRGVLWGRRVTARSWGFATILAALIGGWWLTLMTLHHGTEFVSGWFRWTSPTEIVGLAEQATPFLGRIALLGSPLYLMLSLLGLLRVFGDNASRQDEPDWRHRRSLLIWTGVALMAWLFGGTIWLTTFDGISAWRAYLILPLLMLAVVGLMDIADRRLSFALSFSVLVFTLAWGILWGWGTQRSTAVMAAASTLLKIGVSLLLIGSAWAAFQWARDHRQRQRRLLSFLIVLVFCTHAIAGIRGVHKDSDPEDVGRRLLEAQEATKPLGNIRHVTFVSPDEHSGSSETTPPSDPSNPSVTPIPPLLRWLIKSRWPRAAITTAPSWERALAGTATGSMQPTLGNLARTSSGSARPKGDLQHETLRHDHLIVVWGPRGQLAVPPLTGPAVRVGPLLGIDKVDAALFAVPAAR